MTYTAIIYNMAVPLDDLRNPYRLHRRSLGTIRTAGRSEIAYDNGTIGLADELADSLEGGPHALFFTSNERTGIGLEDRRDYLMIYLFVYYLDEEIWVRNSPGLVEIRIPSDWEDAWEVLADEVLKIMPDFDLDETEEIPAECIGDEDMGECWPEEE